MAGVDGSVIVLSSSSGSSEDESDPEASVFLVEEESPSGGCIAPLRLRLSRRCFDFQHRCAELCY